MSAPILNETVTIALDAMGGDFGPDSVIPGTALFSAQNPSVRFLAYGDERRIHDILKNHKALEQRTTVIHTDRVIAGDEKPSTALRSSKGSSMRMAIEAVASNEAQAIVSSGNTGALMAVAKIVLRGLPGIHRPAIASIFPTMGTDTIMLDLGANVLVDAENLVQFAVMGALFARAHKGIVMPSVGLLNVGTEATKGPDHVRGAAAILEKIDFPGRYYGFVEGNDITKGTVDVVVSDGYAGNIALKTAEGVGKLTGHIFKDYMKSDPLAVLGGLLAYRSLKRLKNKMDPRLYNGGVFLGLGGVCVKSHGGSDALAFSSALRMAHNLVQHRYIEKATADIGALVSQETFLETAVYED